MIVSNRISDMLEKFDKNISDLDDNKYILKLYVTGSTNRSIRAIANIKGICEEYLNGRYELEVIDLYLSPQFAKMEQIIAAPTLIKKSPFPVKRILGDMSDTDKVLLGLDVRRAGG